MAYDKNVFILGAGASVEAGAPVLNDFLKRARTLLDNPKSGLTPEERKIFKGVFDWRGHIYPALRFLKVDVDNLEDLFSLVDMACQLDILKAKRVRTDLIRLVLRTLELSVEIDTSSGQTKPETTYSNFAELLNNWQDQRRKDGEITYDGIVTFNYDTVIDQALFFHTIEFTYGPPWMLESQSHKLLKLHGSINWAVCPNCDHLAVISFFGPGRKERIRLFEAKTIRMIPATMALNTPCPKCVPNQRVKEGAQDTEIPFLTPFIVPPTWNKMANDKYLRPVWQAAREELKQAFRLIIVGYSLPKTDSFFKYLLTLGLSENESLQEIILIDPAKDKLGDALRERYLEFIAPFFDTNNFYFWNVPFSKALKALDFKRKHPRESNATALQCASTE